MSVDTQIDLEEMHGAIVASVRSQFPSLVTVGDYGESRKSLLVPAVLVELIDMEAAPDADPGTEQLAVVTHWVARAVMSFKAVNAKIEVRKLAAALGNHVHQQRWGLPVAPAKVTIIGPDAFDPDMDRFEVWAVEWEQVVHIGASVFDDTGIVPTEVLIGYTPDIGPGHEADYHPFDGELTVGGE